MANEISESLDVGHRLRSDMSIACLITYWVTAFLIPYMGRPVTPVGILWAVISTVFVYKDTRSHTLAAGISRLAATLISLLLCLSYLSLFPITSFGMAVLIAIGTLIAMSLDWRDDIGLTAITTAVVMIVRRASLSMLGFNHCCGLWTR